MRSRYENEWWVPLRNLWADSVSDKLNAFIRLVIYYLEVNESASSWSR